MSHKNLLRISFFAIFLLSSCSPLLLKPDVNKDALNSTALSEKPAEIEPKLYPPPPTEITIQPDVALTPTPPRKSALSTPSGNSEEVSPAPPTALAELPGGAALRQGVAFLLNLPPQELVFVALARLDWPDSCLGLAQPDESCSAVLTPGYRGLVQARGQMYVFHSDLEGKQVRLAPLSGGQSQQPVTTPTGTAIPTAEATATTPTTAIPTASGTTIPDLAKSTPTYTTTAQAPPRLVEELARLLKVGSQHLVIHNLQPIIWPNLCFDFKRKDTPLCNQIPTRGYQGSVTVTGAMFGGDPQYEFHSNEKGDLLYVMPSAALAARQSLANQLDIQVGEIYFDRVEPWTWPNTCALTPTPSPTGEVCLEIQIPGWRVVLGAEQVLYEFHTDTNGQVIQLVPADD